MQRLYSIGVLFVFVASLANCNGDEESNRDQKLISTFQIVRFPNDPCVGSNSRNGTCYTSQECSDKSGTSAGSCADGFGVCCTFLITACGSTTSENLTAWTQPSTVSSGTCGLTVCPIDDSICSIRLDFTNFVITGPNTRSTPSIRRRYGHPAFDDADVYVLHGSAATTSCQTDVFYMKSASPSTGPPSLCGTNTGHHIYLEADVENCNQLTFELADAATTAAQVSTFRGVSTLATRTWDITISQIECTSATNPPLGCTKYYWNTNSGFAQLISHNFGYTANQLHLAMQHDRYCIRRERGMCVGCFSAAATGFKVSGNSIAKHYTAAGGCCGYTTQAMAGGVATANAAQDGNAIGGPNTDADEGQTQMGWDCIIIPGAYMYSNAGDPIVIQTDTTMSQVLTTAATTQNTGQGPHICGQGAGIGAGKLQIATNMNDAIAANAVLNVQGSAENLTVCTRLTPFILEFMSDDIDGLGGVTAAGQTELSVGGNAHGANTGFSILHKQLAC